MVAIAVNGTEIGELRFNGGLLGADSFEIPPGTLTEGANTVTRDGARRGRLQPGRRRPAPLRAHVPRRRRSAALYGAGHRHDHGRRLCEQRHPGDRHHGSARRRGAARHGGRGRRTLGGDGPRAGRRTADAAGLHRVDGRRARAGTRECALALARGRQQGRLRRGLPRGVRRRARSARRAARAAGPLGRCAPTSRTSTTSSASARRRRRR